MRAVERRTWDELLPGPTPSGMILGGLLDESKSAWEPVEVRCSKLGQEIVSAVGPGGFEPPLTDPKGALSKSVQNHRELQRSLLEELGAGA